jgi:AcrR family transcriptional regulator
MLQPKPVEVSRRKPSQARSLQTVGVILDAAAQILERQGEDAVTTNEVAERSGFSIGTLYQYFANRDEILIALADREQQRVAERMRTLIGQIELGNGLDSARGFIEALVHWVKRRRGARRYLALTAALRNSGRMPALGDEFATVLEQTWNRLGDHRGPRITKIHAYVLTHAVLGVLRDAALSHSKLMDEPEFKEALFRMVVAFSRHSAPSPRQTSGH